MNNTDWFGWAAMNGYGLYVWGSVGMCVLALATEVLLLRARQRRLLGRHARQERP
jgi:heme exporter protein D